MEQWYRQNKVLIPWAIIGLELTISLGLRLYKIKNNTNHTPKTIPSPAETLLPKLSEDDAAELAYPPDAYPGARDVSSPYGSLRVYEWGPKDGRKVVLIHGISNPCIAVGAIAHGLVDRGCRVLLFDHPGKGYSSTPLETPHSAALFTTSILLALASSPISWTGNGAKFALVGYSLGGGIAANFTSHFPTLVSSLVLLAPAGLVRNHRIAFTNKLLYNTGLLSEDSIESIVKKKLQRGDPPTKASVTEKLHEEKQKELSEAPILSRNRPGISVANVVAWQINNHPGYVKSYISSIRYGPITNQHPIWQQIGRRLSAQNASTEGRYVKEGLQNGKVLMILGNTDAVVVKEELVPDATEVFGAGNLEIEYMDAGHELPMAKSAEIAECIWRFWEGG